MFGRWMVTQRRFNQPKKTSGTLYSRQLPGDAFSAGTYYANVYFPPNNDCSGLATGDGSPGVDGDLVFFQEGEAALPLPDDRFVDAVGNSWLVETVRSELQFSPNWGVHSCKITQLN